MTRPRLIRSLRIAWSAWWGILCVLLIVFWVRSYSFRDGFWGRVSEATGFRASSFAGRIRIQELRFMGIVPWQPAIGESMDVENYPMPLFAHFEFAQNGFGTTAAVPYWFIVATAVAFTVLPSVPSFRSRFSLRTLFIATTLIAVVLGLVVWSSS